MKDNITPFLNLGLDFQNPQKFQSLVSPEQLQSLGINTNKIDKDIQTEIDTTLQNTPTVKTVDDFQSNLDTLIKDNGLSEEEGLQNTLQIYKERGWTIEGINIDEELATFNTNIKPTELNNSIDESQGDFIDRNIGSVLDTGIRGAKSIYRGLNNFEGGAVSQIPEIAGNLGNVITSGIVGNTIGKGVDVVGDLFGFDTNAEKAFDKFGNFLQELGTTGKEGTQALLGVDPDSILTKAGGIGAEIGTLFIPGGQAKLIAKFPQFAKKIKGLATQFTNLQKTAPQTYKILSNKLLKSSGQGAVESGKFEAVSEGEISKTGLVVGAVANPLVQGTGKVIKYINPFGSNPNKILRELVGSSKSNVTKIGLEAMEKDIQIGLKVLKEANVSKADIETVYKIYKNKQASIYKDNILPRLKEANGTGNISIKGFFNDVLTGIKTTLGDKTVFKGVAQKDLFKGGLKDLKDLAKNVKTFDDIETLKQLTSFNAYNMPKDSGLRELYTVANKKLQVRYDELLEEALGKGKGVKELKREYAALSNLTDSLSGKVSTELRNATSLVEQFGILSAMNNIAKGDLIGGAQSLMGAKLTTKLRDPQTKLDKLLKILRTEDKITNNKAKLTGAASSSIGTYLDNNQ